MPPALSAIPLDTLVKVVGLVGTLISTVKGLVIYVADHSLERKTRKSAGEIDIHLGRLTKLENEKLTLSPEIEQYRLQIKEDLQDQLKALDRVRTLKQRRALAKNAEPTGVSRWLLLYKPPGFDGWLIHSFYYACVLLMTTAVIEFPILLFLRMRHQELRQQVPVLDSVFPLLAALIFAPFALYSRSISLRMKSIQNTINIRAIKSPNSDLSWFQRTLLIFRKGDGLWPLRGLFYLLLFDAVFYNWIQSDIKMTTAYKVIPMLYGFLLAWVVRIDVLSRRAKKRLLFLLGPEELPSGMQANHAAQN